MLGIISEEIKSQVSRSDRFAILCCQLYATLCFYSRSCMLRSRPVPNSQLLVYATHAPGRCGT